MIKKILITVRMAVHWFRFVFFSIFFLHLKQYESNALCENSYTKIFNDIYVLVSFGVLVFYTCRTSLLEFVLWYLLYYNCFYFLPYLSLLLLLLPSATLTTAHYCVLLLHYSNTNLPSRILIWLRNNTTKNKANFFLNTNHLNYFFCMIIVYY